MRKTILFVSSILAFAGCDKPETRRAEAPPLTQTPAPEAAAEGSPGPQIDPCTFLTSEEVQAVLGEPIKQVKHNEKIEGILMVTQCLFELPTVSNSIVLTVTQKSSAPEARDPREVWNETFTGEKADAKSTGRRKVKPPRPLEGLGEGAFWAGSPKRGALYVLKGNSYFRVSVGGDEKPDIKIEKCKALAQKVLAHQF